MSFDLDPYMLNINDTYDNNDRLTVSGPSLTQMNSEMWSRLNDEGRISNDTYILDDVYIDNDFVSSEYTPPKKESKPKADPKKVKKIEEFFKKV